MYWIFLLSEWLYTPDTAWMVCFQSLLQECSSWSVENSDIMTYPCFLKVCLLSDWYQFAFSMVWKVPAYNFLLSVRPFGMTVSTKWRNNLYLVENHALTHITDLSTSLMFLLLSVTETRMHCFLPYFLLTIQLVCCGYKICFSVSFWLQVHNFICMFFLHFTFSSFPLARNSVIFRAVQWRVLLGMQIF
jgi:hypothetical protein